MKDTPFTTLIGHSRPSSTTDHPSVNRSYNIPSGLLGHIQCRNVVLRFRAGVATVQKDGRIVGRVKLKLSHYLLRATSVHSTNGRRLLRSDQTAWRDLYQVVADQKIIPVPGNRDAKYTYEKYKPDREEKLKSRQLRFRVINSAIEILRNAPTLLALLRKAARKDEQKRQAYMFQIEFHRKKIQEQWQNLERYLAIPADADKSCACNDSAVCKAPDFLSDLMLDMANLKPT